VGCVAAGLTHPDQIELLLARPELVPSSVEEILRWTSPVGSFVRTASEDLKLAGTRIAAGDTVGLFPPPPHRRDDLPEEVLIGPGENAA
jgi:cytochrome P450